MRTTLSWVLAMAGSVSLVGCSGDGPPVGPGCSDLGSTATARRITAVLTATDRLSTNSTALAGTLDTACNDMADELAIEVPAPGAGQLPVEASCGAVAAEIETILTAALPAGATLVITAEPPRCSVDVDAIARCAADCDVEVMGRAEVTCTGGNLAGRCDATCTGECRIDGTAVCASECRGTCDGSCDGNCTGTCAGTCDAMNSNGDCIGSCDGTCMGSCSASCTGTCMGTCVSEVTGMCEGTCSGTCSVELVMPQCEGDTEIAADASCQAGCESRFDAEAQCSEPQVTVTVSMPVDLAAEQRLADLIGALQRHWPAFLSASSRLQATLAAGQDLVTSIGNLRGIAGEVGAQAAACLAVSANTAASAVTTLNASVTVSVEVSASVTVTGS
jgi:hypothetical protein